MDRASLIFCIFSLAASLLLSALLFPVATVPRGLLEASQTATPAYEMEDVDLGEFGVVSVQEMVDYYVENPPLPVTGGAAAKPRFQGC